MTFALVLAGTLVAAGCSGPAEPTTRTPQAPSLAATTGADRFAGQQLDWTTCGKLQCATAEVPLDWADPDGAAVSVALNRQPATGGDPVGSLFVNPGGPGASGVDFLGDPNGLLNRLPAEVAKAYDVVAFDPRGVQHSTSVDCGDPARLDALISTDQDYGTDAGIAAARAAYAAFGAACLDGTGSLLGHVDTVSAAKDLDVLRSAVGDRTLTYLGYSYGTQLGATYAALFPDRVGRLVLDGALDPTLSADALATGQAAGFESALRAYVADCQAGRSCPLSGTVDDGMARIAHLLDGARTSPLPTGTDRPLTGTLAFAGVALALYDQGSWPYLTTALRAALTQRDGSQLLRLADVYYERNTDGTFATNATEAFWAIGCADDRSSADPAEMRVQAEAILAVAPTVGEWFAYGGVICADWPVPEVGGLADYSAQGAAPILVIGTTNDPATPYAWAQSLAQTLSSGVLVTYRGEGHTAYGRGNTCLDGAVDAYLLDGTVPAVGLTC